MDLFKLLGTIAIDNADANRALQETSSQAKGTADTIKRSNQTTQNSNKSAGSSFGNLKSRVAEYKAQGLTTSQAWRRATQDMKSSTQDAESGITGAFKKIGAAVATYMTVDAIVNFGSSCIQAAADAQAMESQFSQVFGDLEGSASKSLSSIANEAGISENRMKGSFTKIAAFAKTTGMDTESALSLSERAMVAVADSAAFYDRSLEETTESLQSFLKGNYENDAALGLSCTEVTRNEAANKLYGKSFKDLSEAQKQLTLLQMVEDANAASGALGQAARESDTWTNVTGNLKQAWKDFQAVLGENVLPIAVNAVKGMVGAIEGWTAKLPDLINWCKEHKDILAAIGIVVGSLAAAIALYSSGLTFAAVKTSIMTAATTAFGSVMAFITSPITLTVLAIGALVAALVVAYNKFDGFKAVVDGLKEKLVSGFNAMKEAAGAVKDKIAGAWDEISARCEPLVSAIKENLIGAFNDLKAAGQGVKERFDELKAKFQPIADFLSGAFSSAASSASDWFDKLTDKAGDLATGALSWLNIKITAARDAFSQFADFAGRLWDNLEPLVTLIRDNLLNALQGLSEPLGTIKEAFQTVGDTIFNHLLPALRDALMPLWESLKSALSGVAGILGGALVGAFGLAVGAINGIVNAISGFATAISGMVEIAANVIKLIVGIFTGDGEAIKEAVVGIKDGIVDVFGGLWDAVSGFVSGFVDGVVGFFQGLWDTLVGHSIVPDTINGVINCFSGLWEGVSGFVSDFVGNVTDKFNELKDKASETWDKLKSAASEKWESIKSTVSEKASGAKEKAVSAWNTLKDKTSSAFSSAKDKASSAWTTLKDKVSSTASSTKDKAASAWNTLKDKTSSAFSTAKDKASSSWNTLKSKISSVATSTKDKAASAWSTLKDKTSSAFSTAKDKASSAFSTLKSKITSSASSAESSAGSKFNSMKSKISSAVNAAKSVASSAFSGIKSVISSGASGAFSAVSSKFGSIKTKISSVMSSAKSVVSSGLSSIASKFKSTNWSLPKVKMPHFSISGSFSLKPPSVPKISVSWYKKAMDNAMILDQPTIFGYSAASGKYLGGGEAGNEVIAGQSTLMNMIQNAVAAQNEAVAYYLQKLIEMLADYFPQILEGMDHPRPAVLGDPNYVANQLAVPMNNALGKLSSRKDRGR